MPPTRIACAVCGQPSYLPRGICKTCWREIHDKEVIAALKERQQAKVRGLREARKKIGDGALADQIIAEWRRRPLS